MSRIETILESVFDLAVASASDSTITKGKTIASAMRTIVSSDPMNELADLSSHHKARTSINYNSVAKVWYLEIQHHKNRNKLVISDANPYKLAAKGIEFLKG